MIKSDVPQPILNALDALNAMKPTKEEIEKTLDEYDEELVDALLSDYEFVQNQVFVDYHSELLNVLFNTNIHEKGLAEFNFINLKSYTAEFGYTDNGELFFLDNGDIYLENEEKGRILVSDSEWDFFEGMLATLKANIDFGFRKSTFFVEQNIAQLLAVVPNENSAYFVERLRFAYSDF